MSNPVEENERKKKLSVARVRPFVLRIGDWEQGSILCVAETRFVNDYYIYVGLNVRLIVKEKLMRMAETGANLLK